LRAGRRLVRVLAIVCLIAFLWLALRYFERSQIFYPTRIIGMTPKNIGLGFEDVYFRTDDGLSLNGWFVKADTNKGVVLFCHGNAGNISHRLESIFVFKEMGFDVFIFDYRGYGRSRGWTTEKGVYADALAAYNYLVRVRSIPYDRVVVFGRSLGGNVAIDLATRVKAACLISESAFASIEDMARAIYGVRPPRWVLSNHFDAQSKISKVKMPKLIIHSRDDELVPFEHGQKIFNSALEPKDFFELTGSHNEYYLGTRSDYAKKIKSFIEQNLYSETP